MCIPVVGVRNAAKPLLSRCVPNLKFDTGLVHGNNFILQRKRISFRKRSNEETNLGYECRRSRNFDDDRVLEFPI